MTIPLSDLYGSPGSEFGSRTESQYASHLASGRGSRTGSRYRSGTESEFGLPAAEWSPAPSPLHDLESTDLVQACLAFTPGAWEEFADRFRDHIATIARRTLRQGGFKSVEGLAQDVVGEVFAELLAHSARALRNFAEPFSLKGWLTVITRRKTYRVAKRARAIPTTLEEPERIPEQRSSVCSDMAKVEEHQLVLHEVTQLPRRDRLLLQLFYKGSYSYKEIARILEIPEAHVGTLLARARRRLAKALGE